MQSGNEYLVPPFTNMVNVLEPMALNDSRLEQFHVTEDTTKWHNITANNLTRILPGTYMRLIVRGVLMMSDTPYERRSNRHFVASAVGDVLIGGLGLGLIVLPLVNSESVKSVTVIEKYQNVIDMVYPQLVMHNATVADKMTVICADMLEWKPAQKYDTIYFDIWPDISADNYDDMKVLHRRFGRCINREGGGGFIDSWERGWIKYMRRQDKRYG